jgi:hypothetical protein
MTLILALIAVFLTLLFCGLVLQLLTLPFYMYAMCRGAFYSPCPQEKVDIMVEVLKKHKVKKALDLGSGDGRIVISLAEAGIKADGYEINPLLVFQSQWKVRQKKLSKVANIYCKDFWNEDVSSYEALTLYGISWMMPKLEKKLNKELKKGTLIVSKYFQFPNWKPIEKQGDILVYEKIS